MGEKAGIRQQRRKRIYLRIRKEVEVREGEKFIAVYPADGYSVSYTIDFPEPIGQETFEVELDGGSYLREIAPARTFGFLQDEIVLRNIGLIRGANAENLIVLTHKDPKHSPLLYPIQ